MTDPVLTKPEPFLVLAIAELMTDPPVELALLPEYIAMLEESGHHDQAVEFLNALTHRGDNDEGTGNS